MKALVILECEDCTYDEIEEFGVDEIQLNKKGGGCFLWNNGFKIVPMPNKQNYWSVADDTKRYHDGWNACIDEILGE